VKISTLLAALATTALIGLAAPAQSEPVAAPVIHGYGYNLYGSYSSYTLGLGDDRRVWREFAQHHHRHIHRHRLAHK
jgi:hypothetical protein